MSGSEQWRWAFRELRQRIWFRAALISLLAVLVALGGAVLPRFIPYDWSIKIGGSAVDTVLSILASSMLAVTTFSLTAMVAAFSGASRQVTPRAVHLLIQDRTAQNALSTFLGGFVFALVSIVALTVGIYGPQGRVILFAGTIVVAVIIVVTLLRWISRLVDFGRVDDAIAMIEEKSKHAIAHYPGPVLMAGKAGRDAAEGAIHCQDTGYVAHVDREALSDLAVQQELAIRLLITAGDFVDPTTRVASIAGDKGPETREKVLRRITVTRNRDFDQDPRFGMQVLAEIAIRALSPAVNDPGTAIEVLAAAQRTLEQFCNGKAGECDELPGLIEVPLEFEAMVETLTRPIARDSAGIAEVGTRLQSMLGSIAQQIPAARAALKREATDALDRNRRAGLAPSDLQAVEAAHQAAFG